VEILAHEIVIAESALPVVRRGLRRHALSRHGNGQAGQKKEQSAEQKQ
jgi:hypothetical protein